MNAPNEVLQKIIAILEPISNIFLFLFTTKTGLLILLFSFLLFFIIQIYRTMKERQLLYQSVKGKNITSKPRKFLGYLIIFFEETGKFFSKIITNFTLILGILIAVFAITGVTQSLKIVGVFVENQKKINELKIVLKHLNQRYKIAEIDVVDQVYNVTTLEINYFDYANFGITKNSQSLQLLGDEIYFDAIILNFEYSEIESGISKNLAIPYRIFSDEMPQAEGTELNIFDESGIPYIYNRRSEQIYGINEEIYYERLREILGFFSDEEAARKAGVRSMYGSAVHKKVRKGDFISIWIEQTGGLVIKNEEQF